MKRKRCQKPNSNFLLIYSFLLILMKQNTAYNFRKSSKKREVQQLFPCNRFIQLSGKSIFSIMPTLVNYAGLNPPIDVLTYTSLAFYPKAFTQIFSILRTLQGLTKSSMWSLLNKNVCLETLQHKQLSSSQHDRPSSIKSLNW